MYNRNKSCVCLDLKSPEGLATARQIIQRSDIMIENFRPGAMDKLGLGYASMRESNSELIHCSLQGLPVGTLRAPHRAG